MNILSELRARFAVALNSIADGSADLVDLVRPSQDPKFGDYQANMAMPLSKRLGKPARDVAAAIVERLRVDDLCQPPEIAGPGFINLRLKDKWLAGQLNSLVSDPRLGVQPAAKPRTYVIDYSAPNVAKPMHVGHIRSTVIGDALCRTLSFLGHRVIGDNHIGDWGTQFGMIIYGYRNFRDAAAFQQDPVTELARLYRLVHKLVEYHEAREELPRQRQALAAAEAALNSHSANRQSAGKPAGKPAGDAKAAAKEGQRLQQERDKARTEVRGLEERLAAVDSDATLGELARQHAEIGKAVLAETARLHAGDAENRKLWQEFVPPCLEEIDKIYRRLGVRFDHTLGESFYHDRLTGVVEDLLRNGIAKETAGAIGVFVEGQAVPMLVRKQDGAFLYATTDLATIQYRMEQWRPDAILYVVGHPQSLHFEQLFAVARLWGYQNVEFQHVSFGSVLGDDRKPYRTRKGDTVGLEGLLDEAVERASAVVSENSPELSPEERQKVSEVVGIGALKYADLSQNRTTDYVFSYDKMLAMNGNTATYMQYAYARVRSIFRRGGVHAEDFRSSREELRPEHPAERALALEILRLSETLDLVVADYRPNQLTAYLFELANRFSTFFDKCPVLKAENDAIRTSRFLLCDLTARTLAKGLELLGIAVVEKM